MGPTHLTTARLQLRVPTSDDVLAIFVIAGDPRTVEHNPADLLSDLDQAEQLVRRWIAHWNDYGFGYWCVREIGRPEIIGYCGLKTTTVQGLSMLNLIYRFAPDSWNHGYATEAAQAVVSSGTARQSKTPIIARIRPENVASQRVATKAGLGRDPELESYGEDGLDLAFTNRHSTASSPGPA